MLLLLYRQTTTQTQTAVKRREMTSLISSLVRIWKIRHTGPGCTFVCILRVMYFPVKHPCLYHKYVLFAFRRASAHLDVTPTSHYRWHSSKELMPRNLLKLLIKKLEANINGKYIKIHAYKC